jgi:hypothetical protein
MKRLGIYFLISLFFLATAIASECDLSVSLLNQDPYPAIPGDYVKLVFQISGLEDSTCGDVTFELLEKYPISMDNSTEKIVSLKSGTFVRSFSSYATVAYKARVDENALDGENPIEVRYSTEGTAGFTKSKLFNLTVKDVRANFEIYVKSFDSATKEITFEILNIAESDVSAVTVELLEAKNLSIYGARTKIIGDLDSNEYTTSDFTIESQEVEIPIRILYTDAAGIRRSTEETVQFNPANFASAVKETSSTKYWIIGIVILAIAYWLYRRNKNKKRI